MAHPLVVEDLRKVFLPRQSLFSRLIRKDSVPFVAVDNVSFVLKEGEILGFLGPNGAGKTTTINMLLNLLTPTQGSVSYFGEKLDARKHIPSYVAYASGFMRLPATLTVRESLRMYGLLYNMPWHYLSKKIDEILAAFALEPLANRMVTTLSAGQTTSVLLARAFLVEPRIILLDEPTAALDPETAHHIRSFITQQNKKHNISILFTSHNMPEVAELCSRILMLKQGAIIADNTPESLASSVSVGRVWFVLTSGHEQVMRYAADHGIQVVMHEHAIEVVMHEQGIARLLIDFAKLGIEYSQISIEKPSLEDYFLSVASSK